MGNAVDAAPAAPSELLKVEQTGRVLTVGLNRPAKRNALNDGIILAIGDCFADLPEGIGAVVIHGIGDHFSSGLDLSELTEHDATEGSAYGFAQYLTEPDGGLSKAMELAERIAANAPLTNFAVLQALPMIAEANPQTGLLMESLMATVAQSDKEAKRRIRAFLDRKTAKVKPS